MVGNEPMEWNYERWRRKKPLLSLLWNARPARLHLRSELVMRLATQGAKGPSSHVILSYLVLGSS
ncbi:uncharacterized protein EI90DRAFT_3053273 [Cantharellus anzutake]|uniref:uncharacterized protein n=1 Tax=Cantharellus anzutake TaxID=1750568 RepID=UPI001906AAF0|nr:uncharacterized protein EI90DRAFT_3053273 [Cantharellus anzutake]KAF8333188.1 hypothetical protein EI90DRAFT_3053273 [Cantharellus anzutake]